MPLPYRKAIEADLDAPGFSVVFRRDIRSLLEKCRNANTRCVPMAGHPVFCFGSGEVMLAADADIELAAHLVKKCPPNNASQLFDAVRSGAVTLEAILTVYDLGGSDAVGVFACRVRVRVRADRPPLAPCPRCGRYYRSDRPHRLVFCKVHAFTNLMHDVGYVRAGLYASLLVELGINVESGPSTVFPASFYVRIGPDGLYETLVEDSEIDGLTSLDLAAFSIRRRDVTLDQRWAPAEAVFACRLLENVKMSAKARRTAVVLLLKDADLRAAVEGCRRVGGVPPASWFKPQP